MTHRIETPYYTLQIAQETKRLCAVMELKNDIHISTKFLPHTYDVVERMAPSVLRTRCFNELNLPFDQEIKATEFGHFFEHVLLDMLCREKVHRSKKKARFSGYTEWNWQNDPAGTFHIFIDLSQKENYLLLPALSSTLSLVDTVLKG